MDQDAWTQGNWNAFVVFDVTVNESRQRCRTVPDQFKATAINHAATYWKLQGHTPPPRRPPQRWPLLEMTPADLTWGEQHLAKVLAAGNTAPDRNFGNKAAGFAAERVVDRWLTERKIKHTWNNHPTARLPDFEISDFSIDLKNHTTGGAPQGGYDADLTEEQRQGSGERDWYLFTKLDRGNMTDLWVLGFQTLKVIMTTGVFYKKGEITRTKLDAPVDCWCIRYNELIKPLEWLGEHYEKKDP